MAQAKTKQTVRERSQAGKPTAKRRKIKQHAKGAVSPVKAFFNKLGRLFSPLSFLLIPFRTKLAKTTIRPTRKSFFMRTSPGPI